MCPFSHNPTRVKKWPNYVPRCRGKAINMFIIIHMDQQEYNSKTVINISISLSAFTSNGPSSTRSSSYTRNCVSINGKFVLYSLIMYMYYCRSHFCDYKNKSENINRMITVIDDFYLEIFS